MTISEYQMIISRDYVRSAEAWRNKGDRQWARYLLGRHIETREMARRLATKSKERKP